MEKNLLIYQIKHIKSKNSNQQARDKIFQAMQPNDKHPRNESMLNCVSVGNCMPYDDLSELQRTHCGLFL